MVKTLTQQQKEAVVKVYTSIYKPKNIGSLAFWLKVSPRTIQRVLDEHKVECRSKSTLTSTQLINNNLTVLKGIDLNLEQS